MFGVLHSGYVIKVTELYTLSIQVLIGRCVLLSVMSDLGTHYHHNVPTREAWRK